MPAHEEINEFQKVVLEGFQGGRLADLAELEDYKTLTARLKKETGTAVLAAVLENLRGASDVSEASVACMNAESDVKASMAAIGSVSMRSYAMTP